MHIDEGLFAESVLHAQTHSNHALEIQTGNSVENSNFGRLALEVACFDLSAQEAT